MPTIKEKYDSLNSVFRSDCTQDERNAAYTEKWQLDDTSEGVAYNSARQRLTDLNSDLRKLNQELHVVQKKIDLLTPQIQAAEFTIKVLESVEVF